MFRRATSHCALSALLISGAAFFGLVGIACNPSPHLDPDGGSAGSGATTTSTNTQQGGGGTGGQGGGDGGTTTSSSSTTSQGGGTTGCDSNADCTYPNNLCDTASGECVECVITDDCSPKPGTVCSKAACVCPVPTEDYCPADGYGPARCADINTAPKDCGVCGHECFGACENGQCADAWEPTGKVGAPSPRTFHVAVWTGTKMIVWGGINGGTFLGDGAVYDPATRTWTPMSPTNAPSARHHATAVWTGSEMIVWGGLGPGDVPLGDGARYNPLNNTWLAVGAGGPSPRFNHTAVWNANPARMIVWGGTDGTVELNTGAYYVPGDAWSELTNDAMVPPPNPPPTERQLHTAVLDDVKTRMIVFGGFGLDPNTGMTTSLGTGSIYDLVPMMDNWFDIGQIGSPPAPRYDHTAIWAGNHMIVWGGLNTSLGLLNDGARFDAQGNNEWTSMGGIAPSARRRHSVVYFKQQNKMVVWGGLGPGNVVLDDGGLFNVATIEWSVSGVQKGPPASVNHIAVATDTAMIIWGGTTNGGGALGTGAILTLSKVP